MNGIVQADHRQGGSRREPDTGGSRGGFRQPAVGRSNAGADGRLPDGVARARRNRRRDNRRRRRDARKNAAGQSAGGRDRHRRHRRRRLRLLQCFDAGFAHRRRLRRTRRQAWQPGAVVALGRQRCAWRARRRRWPAACPHRIQPQGSRPRFHDGAEPSRRHPPCRAGAGRTRHTHDFQHSRARSPIRLPSSVSWSARFPPTC